MAYFGVCLEYHLLEMQISFRVKPSLASITFSIYALI